MTKNRRFWPCGRGIKSKDVVFGSIDFSEEHKNMRPLVISIPRACGNSVKRNRLKRVLKHSLKTYVDSLPEGKGLWIRLLRQHKIQIPVEASTWNEIVDTTALKN